MRHGLRKIGEALGASAVGASRLRAGQDDRRRIVICEMERPGAGSDPLKTSFVHAVLREYAEKAKPGSLWFSSMFGTNLDLHLVELQRKRNWRELVIIPIGSTEKHTDFLELHYQDKLSVDQLGVLDQVAETFVKTWQRRSPGLFSDAVLSRKSMAGPADTNVPLLHLQNPAKLSRCEYRVCMLISHGLTNTAIESELSISKSTLRSHLRNIYAKTETGSLAELTYVLLSGAPAVREDADTGQYIA